MEYNSPVPPAATSAQNGCRTMSATLRARGSRSSDRSLRNGVIGKPNTPVKRVRTSFAVIVALQGNIVSRKGAKTQRKPKRGLLCVFAPLRDDLIFSYLTSAAKSFSSLD